MARTFTSADARRIIDTHNEISVTLSSAIHSRDAFREEIRKAVSGVIDEYVYDILKDVPVDELNRERQGIRVKTLRDCGYGTIADLVGVSRQRLEAINGISPEAALAISSRIAKMASEVREGAKLRLSADRKTAAASRLVTAVTRYKRSLPVAERSAELLRDHERSVFEAASALTPATSGIRWFFSSAEKKRQMTGAYRYLAGLLTDRYGLEANRISNEYREIAGLNPGDGWRDFAENPVSFFNVIEDIEPGVLGADDAVFGLPEDLAGRIRNEELLLDGLNCELRRYQEWGVRYILHQKRVLLGDEMGLGKTVQAIAAMVSLANSGETRFMVICPASVLTNWCREITKMSRLTPVKIHGEFRDVALNHWLHCGGVAVTTYETTESISLPDDFRFPLLVADEAHYVKNPDAKRSMNTARISSYADRLLFMTGTALENRVDEMISLVRILRPDIAGSLGSIAYMSRAPQFRSAVAHVYYRRRREDVLTELPELIENREWCALNADERAKYEETLFGTNYQDVRRVSWNVPDIRRSSKAGRMLELIEEAAADGRKVIVFSFFLDTIRAVSGLLGEKCLPPISGSVPPQRRQEIIDGFEKAPAGTVLATQIQAGGTGLNIQTASVVIICEPQFKPSAENQAISRAYRMGQTRNVLVYRLLCENTVDERLTELLENKQAIFDAFADRSEAAEESFTIDERTFGNLIREEIERITAQKAAAQKNSSE